MIELKPVLDRLYSNFNHPDSATDPIQIVRRFTRDDDREIVAFIAAALAFGRVASVLQSIERVLAVMGPAPAAYVRAFDPARDRAASTASSTAGFARPTSSRCSGCCAR